MYCFKTQFITKNKGHTLIELSLSIFLMIILIQVLLSLYMGSQSSYQLQLALNDIQFEADRIFSILKEDIQKAGFIGCAKLSKSFKVESHFPYTIRNDNKLFGTDHSLTVQYASLPGSHLIEPYLSERHLFVNANNKFTNNHVFIISSCSHSELFKADYIFHNGRYQILTLNHALYHQYDIYDELSFVIKNYYYTEKSKGDLALYRISNNKEILKIADHIRALRFLYTIKTGDHLDNLKAKQIQDWSRVIGVLIFLKIKSHGLEKSIYNFVLLR